MLGIPSAKQNLSQGDLSADSKVLKRAHYQGEDVGAATAPAPQGRCSTVRSHTARPRKARPAARAQLPGNPRSPRRETTAQSPSPRGRGCLLQAGTLLRTTTTASSGLGTPTLSGPGPLTARPRLRAEPTSGAAPPQGWVSLTTPPPLSVGPSSGLGPLISAAPPQGWASSGSSASMHSFSSGLGPSLG